MRTFKNIFCIFALVLPALAVADSTAESSNKWDGETSLGLTIASGNTETKNANGSLNLANERVDWRHAIRFEALYSEDSKVKTAQKWMLSGKSDYKLPDNHFLFVAGSYEDDDFSAYDYQATVALGYGIRLIDESDRTLDVEIGPGYRRSELQFGGSESEAIVRLGAKYNWDITDTAKFTQGLTVEAGSDATIIRSSTALTTKISEAFSLRTALDIKHDTGAPAGSDKTDTQTTVSVVYTF